MAMTGARAMRIPPFGRIGAPRSVGSEPTAHMATATGPAAAGCGIDKILQACRVGASLRPPVNAPSADGSCSRAHEYSTELGSPPRTLPSRSPFRLTPRVVRSSSGLPPSSNRTMNCSFSTRTVSGSVGNPIDRVSPAGILMAVSDPNLGMLPMPITKNGSTVTRGGGQRGNAVPLGQKVGHRKWSGIWAMAAAISVGAASVDVLNCSRTIPTGPTTTTAPMRRLAVLTDRRREGSCQSQAGPGIHSGRSTGSTPD